MKKEVSSNLSVTLLIGLLLKNVPIRLMQPFFQKSIDVMNQKYPRVFEKIAKEQTDEEFDYIIDAIDLPFVFYLKPSVNAPILRLIKRDENIVATAVLRGSFVDMLKMFEGKLDGDAAFFSKVFVLEGSTVAVLALRNAVDSQSMNIVEDLSDIFSPFNKQFKFLANVGIVKYSELQSKLDIISDSITSKVTEQVRAMDSELGFLYNEVDEIKKTLAKLTKEEIRKKSDYQQKT